MSIALGIAYARAEHRLLFSLCLASFVCQMGFQVSDILSWVLARKTFDRREIDNSFNEQLMLTAQPSLIRLSLYCITSTTISLGLIQLMGVVFYIAYLCGHQQYVPVSVRVGSSLSVCPASNRRILHFLN